MVQLSHYQVLSVEMFLTDIQSEDRAGPCLILLPFHAIVCIDIWMSLTKPVKIEKALTFCTIVVASSSMSSSLWSRRYRASFCFSCTQTHTHILFKAADRPRGRPEERQRKRRNRGTSHQAVAELVCLRDGLLYSLLSNTQGDCERLCHTVSWNHTEGHLLDIKHQFWA